MPHKTIILPVAAVAAGLLLCLLAMLVYDNSRSSSVAQGIKVADVDIGGLDAEQARQRVSAQLVAPLDKPLTVPAGDRQFHLTAREARISTDVDAIIDDAVQRSREGGMLARTWRGITGAERNITLKPQIKYSAAAVDRLVTRVERSLNRPAVDAKVEFQPDDIATRDSRTGRRVDAKRLRAGVRAELVSPVADRTVRPRLRTVEPKVTDDKLADRYPVVVMINRGAFRLTLFKGLKRVKSYPIAVGKVGLETPAGLYSIANKAINPAWHVPNSDWAGSLAGKVIPGGAPDNPIKSRWLGIHDGVGVHGTADRGSIGSNASHGCIRMLIEDVEALYDEVPAGAPTYIH